MKSVNIHEAKTHLSRLIADVERGEEIIISRGGKPVARLLKFEPAPAKREMGFDRGLFEIPEDFDAPMPDFEAELYGDDEDDVEK
ncbi:MAG: type II toxin-antitoxin system Phd/YefM family antitoxin [Acidobacteria bacterium]|nr:type II toxin-antitoxin system Phd/YefM family antitoxin [Acidobacteriota bacterium]